MARELTYTIRVLSEQAEEKVRRVETAMKDAAAAAGTNGFAKAERQLEAAMKDAERASDKLSVTIAKQKDATVGADKQTASMIGTLTKFAGAVGIAFSVQQVVQFGKAVMDDADALTKMQGKTDLSLQAIQRLQVVGDDTSVSLESMSSAIGQMQNRLASGDDSFVGALRRARITLEDFQDLGPEQQFYAISDAIRSVRDPAQQAAMAVDFFGRSGLELLPALKRGFDDVRNASVGMSDDTVEAWDEAGDTLDAWTREFKGMVATGIVESVRLVEDGFNPAGEALDEMVRLSIAVNAQLEKMGRQMPRPEAFRASLPAALSVSSSGEPQFAIPPDAERWAAEQEAQIKRNIALRTAEAKALKDYNDRWVDILATSQAFGAVVDTIDGSVVEAIRHFVDQGNSLEALGEQYELTTAQVRGLAAQMKFEQQTIDLTTKTFGRLGQIALPIVMGLTDEMKRLTAGFDDEARAAEANNAQLEQQVRTRRALMDAVTRQNIPLPAVQVGIAGADQSGPNPFATIFDGVPEIMAQALASSGKIENALRAAVSKIGAQVGEMIGDVFGEMAGEIGKQVGAMVGYVAEKMWDAFTTSSGEDVARRIGQNWGIQITEAMGDQIAKDAAELFNGSRQAAELWNMRRLFELDPENLGITPRNFDVAAGKLHDVFSMIATDQMTIAQGAKVIDENWDDLVAAGTDTFGFIDARLKRIIALDQQYGTQSKEIAEFLTQQAEVAVKASNDIIAALTPQIAAWKQLRAQVDLFGGSMAATADAHRGELEDLGVIAVSTFGAAIAAGKSFAEALALAGPGLAQLSDAFQTLGIDTDNAALRVLMLQNNILQRNPALIQGVSGLGSAYVALSNMGMLNVDTFNALGRTGAAMYARIQAEVAAMGGTTEDALLPMQDYLHKAEEAARQLGIPLDENTKMLIDQSKELGIWKDTGLSATDRLMGGIEALVQKMDDFITRITTSLYPAIENIPSPEVRGRVTWDVEAIPQAPGGLGDDAFRMMDVMPMAEGGHGVATGPALFYTKGNEEWAFSGEGKRFGDSPELYSRSTTQAPVTNHFTIHAVDAASFEALLKRNAATVARAAMRGVKDGGQAFGSFRSAVREVVG